MQHTNTSTFPRFCAASGHSSLELSRNRVRDQQGGATPKRTRRRSPACRQQACFRGINAASGLLIVARESMAPGERGLHFPDGENSQGEGQSPSELVRGSKIQRARPYRIPEFGQERIAFGARVGKSEEIGGHFVLFPEAI
jgi:hypothetical protein